jgi:hypothetical protein
MYERNTEVSSELEQRVAIAERQRDDAMAQRDRYIELYNKTRDYVQSSIDRGDWTDEELEEIFWDELADLLDLKIKQEVEITITTYWRATVKLPKGVDIGELADYISVDDPELSHPTAELEDIDVRDTTVDRY